MTSFHIVAVLFLTVSNTSFVAIKGFLSPQLPYVNNKVPQKVLISNQLLSRAANRKVTSTDDGFRRGYHGRAKEKRNDSRKEIFAGTLNLIKAMVGTGILALPMGVAKTSDFELSIIPAIALMAILGSISAYTFSLYGRLIHTSKAKTLGELWEKNVDKKSSWLVSAVSLTFCFGACLSYTLCLGDVTSSLAKTVGLNGIWTFRQFWIVFLASTVLYPLCNLKSLISLAPLSLAGVGAVLITSVFIAFRCPLINQNSPYSLPGFGLLLRTLSPEQLPKFQTFNKGLANPASLILFGMAASAYLGHFIAPDLYHSLGNDSRSNTLRIVDGDEENKPFYDDQFDLLNSFYKITQAGFLSTIIINCSIMTFGFLTFGGNAMGVILNNYSTLDKGATVCRLLTAISVIGGYPFLISACRGEILKLYSSKTEQKPKRRLEKLTTLILMTIVTLLSMVVSDAGLIIGLSGAVMGSALVYIFPSLLYLSNTNSIKPKLRMLILERMFCRFLLVFGIFAASAGVLSVITGV